MGKIEVGDKVRVVACNYGHQFEIGDVVTLLGGGNFEDSYQERWFMEPDEYEPIAPNRIVAGVEYTSHNGLKWKCIFVDGDNAWLAPEGMKSAAYVFKTDGTNISQGGGEYNIKFEPVVKTVNVKGSIHNGLKPDEFITLHRHTGDHRFNMTVDFIDGKPDWSTAKVTEA